MSAPIRTFLLGLAAVAGCAPHVQTPAAVPVTAARWRDASPDTGAPDTGALVTTWRAFGSPELLELLARARARNADLAIATARLVQARGQLGVARAAGRPTLSGAVDAGLGRTGRTGFRADDRTVGLNIAYDVDLFGQARAGKRAARARLAASTFDREATMLVVEAEVARAFIEHAGLGARLRLLAQGLTNARELDRIIGVRVREGAATRVESGLQRIEVRRIEAEISRLEEAQARTRNGLAVLVGDEAPSFAMPATRWESLHPPAISAAQPATLLVRRPDIRAAEARIAAAAGDVAEARAAFLPSLRLAMGAVLETGPLGVALSAITGLVAPIFDGGRRRGQLDTATGVQLETVEQYRRGLLVALGEAENALAGVAQSARRSALLNESVTVARETARLARSQYVEGAADLQVVLDAQRGALDFAEAAVVARQDRLISAIDLYRALGGHPSSAL